MQATDVEGILMHLNSHLTEITKKGSGLAKKGPSLISNRKE